MKIKIEQSPNETSWLVKLDECVVSFRTKQEARGFANKLQARLDSPHNLPDNCLELLAELPLPVRPHK